MEVAGDRLTITHEDVVTGMPIDRDRTRGFAANPRTKDPLEEDEDDLTKAQMYLSPRVAGRTPNKDDKRCFYCQEIGHFVDRCYKKARDRRAAAEKAELRHIIRLLPMGKTPCPYLTQKLTLYITTQRTNTLTS